MKILIVGALSAMTADPDVSGTVISLKHLINRLSGVEGVSISLVDVGGVRKSRFKILAYWGAILKIWNASRTADVITIHQSPDGFSFLGPPVLLIGKLRGVPLVFRMFGGKELDELSPFRRFVAKATVRRFDCYLAQTKRIVQSAIRDGIQHTIWYPTSRPVRSSGTPNPQKARMKRVVFIAHIKRAKGIFELIEASDFLRHVVPVEVYGPFYDGLDASIFEGHDNISYFGSVEPSEVDSILQDAIALALPTYMIGEGYPGTIIEAYNAGLPVIATTWRSLPEVVDETCGLLIKPRDPQALVNAVKFLARNTDERERLSNGAYEKRLVFDQEGAVSKFVQICESLIRDKRNLGVSV